ncbi:hypothetical protein CWS02_00260 [Enterobacter sp. EA-1]|nr:hypothetical protein CWS02_00260 [Enterobacter sp. EA-1]
MTLTAGRISIRRPPGWRQSSRSACRLAATSICWRKRAPAGDSYKASKKTVINEKVRQQGTEIASGTDTVIIAGRDMNAEAAQVTAKSDIGVQAGRDVNLTTATESDYHYKEETKTKKGFLKKPPPTPFQSRAPRGKPEHC